MTLESTSCTLQLYLQSQLDCRRVLIARTWNVIKLCRFCLCQKIELTERTIKSTVTLIIGLDGNWAI